MITRNIQNKHKRNRNTIRDMYRSKCREYRRGATTIEGSLIDDIKRDVNSTAAMSANLSNRTVISLDTYIKQLRNQNVNELIGMGDQIPPTILFPDVSALRAPQPPLKTRDQMEVEIQNMYGPLQGGSIKNMAKIKGKLKSLAENHNSIALKMWYDMESSERLRTNIEQLNVLIDMKVRELELVKETYHFLNLPGRSIPSPKETNDITFLKSVINEWTEGIRTLRLKLGGVLKSI